jgi:hypothetical protein
MPKAELTALSNIDWQLFCTLTSKRERMTDREWQRMIFAWLRKHADWFGRHFPELIWSLRAELGEATARKHYHALIAGLPPHSIHERTCFSSKNAWEGLGGGMARVSVYSRALDGVGYILKGLEEAQTRFAGDFYELTKFGGSCDVTLSKSILRVIEGRRQIGKRRPSSTTPSGVSATPVKAATGP